jgi:hypothetical protein
MRVQHVWAACVAVLLTLNLPAMAQHQHPTQTETLIDGSHHPELISDTTAYRLFLATYAGTDDQHRKLQNVLFGAIGLLGQDRLVMTNALDDFNVRFKQMLEDDTKEVSVVPNTDHATFIIHRDAMMDNILASLKLQPSKVGFVHLDGYVQNEKKLMRISPELERRR